MDATYKTTVFDLPLFFVVVKTNVNYQVVATFIVEHETSNSIKEALHELKVQNPDWKPSYFLTDFDESEINALESEFSGLFSVHNMLNFNNSITSSSVCRHPFYFVKHLNSCYQLQRNVL